MLEPKKVKFRKQQKNAGGGKKLKGSTLSFGQFGLKTLENGAITARQIEAVRQVLSRYTKKVGKVWIRIFPDRPVTFKGVEVPMGGGKGEVVGYEVPLKGGTVLFEIDGITREEAEKAMRIAAHKLGIKTKFVSR